MEHIAEAAQAQIIFQIEKADMAVGDSAHAHFPGFQLHLAQLHGLPLWNPKRQIEQVSVYFAGLKLSW